MYCRLPSIIDKLTAVRDWLRELVYVLDGLAGAAFGLIGLLYLIWGLLLPLLGLR